MGRLPPALGAVEGQEGRGVRGGAGEGGGASFHAKKQQTVRASSRQRPAREVKSGEAGRGGGWKIDAKNGCPTVSAAGGGLGGGCFEATPRRLGRRPRRIKQQGVILLIA